MRATCITTHLRSGWRISAILGTRAIRVVQKKHSRISTLKIFSASEISLRTRTAEGKWAESVLSVFGLVVFASPQHEREIPSMVPSANVRAETTGGTGREISFRFSSATVDVEERS